MNLGRESLNEDNDVYLHKYFYKALDQGDNPLDHEKSPDDIVAGLSIYKHTYHIIFNQSYQVPTLYFTINDHKGTAVDLDWIWKRIPRESLPNCASERDYASIITQVEHPILGIPFCYVHPCFTSSLMRSSPASSPSAYLVAWLSTVANLVGLALPLGYCSQ